jgi:hypothetical protein
MKPGPWIQPRIALTAAGPAVLTPARKTLDHSTPLLAKETVQMRTQRLFDYLANTLIKTW